MEEDVWLFGKQTQVLEALLAETRTVWRDEAARTLYNRFLQPQREYSNTMEIALGNQQEQLTLGVALFARSEEYTAQIEMLHQAVRSALAITDRDCKEAYQHCENALRTVEQARNLFDQIEDALRRANNACG